MPESASSSRATEVTFSDLLDLDDLGDGRYRGVCHEGAPARAFGGQVAAQAFTAAAKTAPAGQQPASMHAYFVKTATAGEPVDYVVTVAGDGNTRQPPVCDSAAERAHRAPSAGVVPSP